MVEKIKKDSNIPTKKSQTASTPTPEKDNMEKEMGDLKKKVEMAQIIADLKKKMLEIDEISKKLDEKRKEIEQVQTKKTEKLLQEIKVPPLELLK